MSNEQPEPVRRKFMIDINPGQMKKFEGFWWRVDSLENNQVTMTAIAPGSKLQLLQPSKQKRKRKKKR
jgi:hypothetical protein